MKEQEFTSVSEEDIDKKIKRLNRVTKIQLILTIIEFIILLACCFMGSISNNDSGNSISKAINNSKVSYVENGGVAQINDEHYDGYKSNRHR